MALSSKNISFRLYGLISWSLAHNDCTNCVLRNHCNQFRNPVWNFNNWKTVDGLTERTCTLRWHVGIIYGIVRRIRSSIDLSFAWISRFFGALWGSMWCRGGCGWPTSLWEVPDSWSYPTLLWWMFRSFHSLHWILRLFWWCCTLKSHYGWLFPQLSESIFFDHSWMRFASFKYLAQPVDTGFA